VQLATLAMRERMPASNVSREMVEAGLLMSYGTNIASMFRQVGIYTGSILKGATPADLPVIQSTKFEDGSAQAASAASESPRSSRSS
jgi:putative ABC transport system substrate-binding protein